MNGLLRCNIDTGVRACAGGADVSLSDVTIAQMGSGVTECGWRHAPEERGGFLENLKKVCRVETGHRTRRLTFACSRRPSWRVPHVLGWDRWKNQHRNIVPLSPYVEEPLNSEVIKSFVLEQRSCKCFSNFEIPMFYLYGHSMYVSHMAVSGYGTNGYFSVMA